MKYTSQSDRTKKKNKKDVIKSTNDFVSTFNAIMRCTLNKVDIDIFTSFRTRNTKKRRRKKNNS